MPAFERMLMCRTFGHAWEPSEEPPGVRFQHERIYRNVVVLRCSRCLTVRLDAWNAIGQLGARRYLYDDNYTDLCHDMRETRHSGESAWQEAKRRYLKQVRGR